MIQLERAPSPMKAMVAKEQPSRGMVLYCPNSNLTIRPRNKGGSAVNKRYKKKLGSPTKQTQNK